QWPTSRNLDLAAESAALYSCRRWRVRAAEGATLEMSCRATPYRGFKSHRHRHVEPLPASALSRGFAVSQDWSGSARPDARLGGRSGPVARSEQTIALEEKQVSGMRNHSSPRRRSIPMRTFKAQSL